MSRGFCYLAEIHPEGFPLSQLIESFRRVGICLANPWNGVITSLTDDGDQVMTTESELQSNIQTKKVVTFQLWLSDSVDLTCSFRRLTEKLYVHAYGFDGLDLTERQQVVQWAVDRFRTLAPQRRNAVFVIDLKNETEDFDWDQFVVGKVHLPDVMPEVFGLGVDHRTELAYLPSYSLEEIAGNMLFMKEMPN